MLVRFHRGLGIDPERLQENQSNLRSEISNAWSEAVLFHLVVGNLTLSWELDDKSRDSKLERGMVEEMFIESKLSSLSWVKFLRSSSNLEIIKRQIKPFENGELKEATVGVKFSLKSAVSEVKLNDFSCHLVTMNIIP
ncbi:hypothetical protein H5410_001524 [Solanum commersonii]|uniref:Uncharacterized protein n=1 Tax=Solanum commersonii TaxID=4109 RepID=A0A9J6B0D1_SOLCO|nr:hypothetical protein H5410_001524 [Solanum commersonii]